MTIALFTHPDCLLHQPPSGHPERPERLAAILAALETPEFASLDRRLAPLAEPDALVRVHHAAYVRGLLDATPAPDGMVPLDADTWLGPGTLNAALRAAGGAMAAIDSVLDGSASHAFVATRPPGHHAEPDRAMGFCLFNTVAVAALHARARHHLARIAVLDFDVHHGNGTQAMFWSDPDLFYASTHQSPCYPGTGAVTERGVAGNIHNRPLPPGSGTTAFRTAWTSLLEQLAAFAPDLVILSAGFDAHRDDPLAALTLTEPDFAWLAARIAPLGRTVSVLEGGYDIDALASSTAAWLRVFLEQDNAS